MIKDIKQIIENLLHFYNFENKTLLSVGAGGGQFIAYAKIAKHVIAVDNDKKALQILSKKIKEQNLENKFTLIHSDFMDIDIKSDVVFFEFCLHEMTNHQKMIDHAKSLSNDIIISDHNIESEWAYIGNEIEKATLSWNIISKNPILKREQYTSTQIFKDYTELFNRVKEQGDISINRIEKYRDKREIEIPMKYEFAQL
ncbi:MAG: class I SAM-dependent methyltransferase [Marinifilaceae bacterium]|jgi:predicted RNA methylase|nr:class I SAM-dependent methyltransferase [Marinifilaceae bacterium]